MDFNTIVNNLIEERISKEQENTRDEAVEDLNKLLSLNTVEEPVEEPKVIEKPVKKTWSKLTKSEKEQIVDEYTKDLLNGAEIKEKILNKTITARNIKFDPIKQKIISVKI